MQSDIGAMILRRLKYLQSDTGAMILRGETKVLAVRYWYNDTERGD